MTQPVRPHTSIQYSELHRSSRDEACSNTPWSCRSKVSVGLHAVIALVVAALAPTANATTQFPELLISTKSSGGQDTIRLYSYPLQHYFIHCAGTSPFQMISTANYRGYVGTWQLSRDSLFLVGIEMDECPLSLDSLFGAEHGKRFFAGYFSGYLTTQTRKRGMLRILQIQNGVLKATTIVSENEFLNPLPARGTSTRAKLLQGALKDEPSCTCAQDSSSRSRASAVERYVASVRDSMAREAASMQAAEQKEVDEKLFKMCSADSGYLRFLDRFKISKNSIGLINFFPYSAFFMLEPKSPKIIRSSWLWIPVVDQKLTMPFKEVVEYFSGADEYLASVPWLQKWASSAKENEVELHMLGGGLGECEPELSTDGGAAWMTAGFAGAPRFKVLLRHKRRALATLYFNSSQSGALLTSLDSTLQAPVPELANTHVFFHDKSKSPQYVILQPDGSFKKFP